MIAISLLPLNLHEDKCLGGEWTFWIPPKYHSVRIRIDDQKGCKRSMIVFTASQGN